MSEGPEVKIIAEKLSSILQAKKIEDIICKNLNDKIKDNIIGSETEYIRAFGKNLVLKFSSNVFLRNHMMMWGKWRIYDRSKYDKGLARPPTRRSYRKSNSSEISRDEKDVRRDSRVRLSILTRDSAVIEFNGPILEFTTDNPIEREPIRSLGPDCLNDRVFDVAEVKQRLSNLKNRK